MFDLTDNWQQLTRLCSHGHTGLLQTYALDTGLPKHIPRSREALGGWSVIHIAHS